ncbi:OmpA family protein [Sphingomonas jatrophae]|uniref:Outer membrane protein OmpA n=1 Tax=Sphingomonas jatrophae TaxID=1166337 RepID=A0A1I6JV31_9SPHN|nr:OmpA family protein [Sphingomonas jatrophae]SFR82854.1 Outer membrane protein OmpA [Sphingomonas jatrophae]
MRVAILLGAAAMLAAPGAAAPPPAQEAMVCGLLGGCGSAATPPRGTPRRVGAARGFSFTRPGGGQAGGTKAIAPAQAGLLDLRIGFVSGSADVLPASRTRLRSFAAALRDPRLAKRRVRITGHTDAVGDPAANLALSRRRADAVAALVAAEGIMRSRLDVVGVGDTQPLPGHAASDPANRRVTAELVD